MTALEILRGAREWLADEDHWIQDFWAKTSGAVYLSKANNTDIDWEDDAICGTCLAGACMRASRSGDLDQDVIRFIVTGIYGEGSPNTWVPDLDDVTSWNDAPFTTHAKVMDVLDGAIRAAEGYEAVEQAMREAVEEAANDEARTAVAGEGA